MAIRPNQTTRDVLQQVWDERMRQFEILGNEGFWDCADPTVDMSLKMAVLVEEIGEVAEAMLNLGGTSMRDDKVFDLEHLQKELVQVAAVAVAICESLELTL